MLIQRTRGRGENKTVRSATMFEGMQSHRLRWQFNNVEVAEHEAAHMLLLYCLVHMGLKPNAFDYQGSNSSEAIAITLQSLIEMATRGGVYKTRINEGALTKRQFIDEVYGQFARGERAETFERTLSYAILKASRAKRRNSLPDYHTIRIKSRYTVYGLMELAEARGVKAHNFYHNGREGLSDIAQILRDEYGLRIPLKSIISSGFWIVEAGEGEAPYTSGVYGEGQKAILKPNLPDNGPDFRKPEKPSEEFLGEIYDRCLPALELIMRKSAAAYRKGLKMTGDRKSSDALFDTILVSELSAAIARKPRPDASEYRMMKLQERAWNGSRTVYPWGSSTIR